MWRILKAFGYKYFGLAIWRISGDFFKALGSKFFGWRNARRAYLHVFAYIFIYF